MNASAAAYKVSNGIRIRYIERQRAEKGPRLGAGGQNCMPLPVDPTHLLSKKNFFLSTHVQQHSHIGFMHLFSEDKFLLSFDTPPTASPGRAQRGRFVSTFFLH